MANRKFKQQIQSTISNCALFSLLVRNWITTSSQDMNCQGQCIWNNRLQIQWFLSNKLMIKNKCIHSFVKVKVTQSCQIFVAPWTIQSMEFSRPENWNGQPFPSPRTRPNPGIKPRPPTLQADISSAEPQGKAPQFQFCNYVQITRI